MLNEIQGFISSIQRMPNCSEEYELKTRSNDLFNRIVRWLPLNQNDSNYHEIAILTLAMLQELYQRQGMEESENKIMSRYAVEVIMLREDLDSDFIDFLKTYLPEENPIFDSVNDASISEEDESYCNTEGSSGA